MKKEGERERIQFIINIFFVSMHLFIYLKQK
jgi:hypothetical protein